MVKHTQRLFQFLMVPFSLIWEEVYRVRRFFYKYDLFKSEHFYVPIISVGNLSFGGTGKTPFTLWLSKYFHAQNKKVMILMRGYRGRREASSGHLRAGRKLGYDSIEYGDEATLYAKKLKDVDIVLGKNRKRNLNFYFPQLKPDLVLLDDGHQHMQLRRDFNIVLFDATMSLSSYKVAPSGYLREGLTALNDADFVMIGKVDQVSSEQVEKLESLIRTKCQKTINIGHMRYRPRGFFNSQYELILRPEEIRGKKVYAFAGIASPESFYNGIEKLGAEIINKKSFPDHHSYTEDDIIDFIHQAENEKVFCLTTEKDIVKLRRLVQSKGLLYLDIEVELISGESELKEALRTVIE